MGNIESYVKWRGDLTFSERPFCEVDNLIFSEAAYYDLAGIVPTLEEGGSIALREAAAAFLQQERSNVCAFGPSADFFAALAESRRFSAVRLAGYRERFDAERQLEFAALRFELDGGGAYVAFRGTSDSLVGWREDFNMSFQRVPAQEQAAGYLSETLAGTEGPVCVGGHSKGGNLAVYAAMMAAPEQRERIAAVYTNDGPGFCPELLDAARYQAVTEKVIRIVPAFCVVGELFGAEQPAKIVTSSQTGLMQHEGMSWQVEGDHFCETDALSRDCRTVNEIFDRWIESASMEERRAFVSDFFDALEAGGAKRLSGLAEREIGDWEDILLTLTVGSRKGSRAAAGKLVASVLTVLRNLDLGSLAHSKYAISGAVCFVLGLCFMAAPGISVRFVGLALGLGLMLLVGRQIVRGVSAGGPPDGIFRVKLVAQLCVLCAAAFFTAVFNLVFHVTNLIAGVFFLVNAFVQVRRCFQPDCARREKPLRGLAALLCFMMGVVPIVSPGLLLESYALCAGTLILVYGAVNLIYAMYCSGAEAASRGKER